MKNQRVTIISLDQGFSNLAQLIFGAGSFLVVGGCPVRCRAFLRLPGLCPPDISNTYFNCDNQRGLLSIVPRGQTGGQLVKKLCFSLSSLKAG